MTVFLRAMGAVALVAAISALTPALAHAAIVTRAAGVLTYTADGGETNAVNLSYDVDADKVVITDPGNLPLANVANCAPALGNLEPPAQLSCDTNGLTTVVVNLGDLGDSLAFGTWNAGFALDLNGGDGNDDITSPAVAATDSLDGGAGDDALTAGPGTSTLIGGAGADDLRGGGGTDTADYSAATLPLRVTIDSLDNDGAECAAGGAPCEGDNVGGPTGDIENVTGGSGGDELIGSSAGNLLAGSGGDDKLYGGDGQDALQGGAGADELHGEGANDNLSGGTENDTLDGGGGDDALAGDANTDTVTYAGRLGDVVATVNDGGGEPGAVEADTYATVERLIGGDGDDTLTGDAGPNTLDGGAGDDTLAPGTEPDAGTSGAVSDRLVGGAGTGDVADYTVRTENLTITLDGEANDGDPESGLNGNVAEADDVEADVEHVAAGSGHDTVTGSVSANELRGGDGNDTLRGLGAADLLDGEGGAGDRVTYTERSASLSVTLDAQANDGEAAEGDNALVEFITGGQGADTLVGDAVNNHIAGAGGDDTLDGGGAADELDGQNGVDTADYSAVAPVRNVGVTVTVNTGADDGDPAVDGSGDDVDTENVVGTAHGDNLTGDGGANRLDGLDGQDALTGAGLADDLRGGAGDDHLDGGGDDDVLDGGEGADDLFGSAGTGDRATWAGRTGDVVADVDVETGDDGVGCAAAETCEGDTVRGDVEHLTGGNGDDDLTGDEAATTLDGGPGDDVLDGGPDGTVADTFVGGAGAADVVTYRGRIAGVTASLDAAGNDGEIDEDDAIGDDVEGLEGGDGDDVLTGSAGADQLRGGPGDDTITSREDGAAVADLVGCGAGTDDSVTADLIDQVNPDCEASERGTPPTIEIQDASVVEDGETLSITVALSTPTAETVTAQYATSDGTAAAGQDYTSASGTVTFTALDTTETISVPVSDDALDEADETLTVTLTSPANATFADDSATGTITDDDDAPSVSAGDAPVAEGGATLSIPVTLSAASSKQVTVEYATSNGTAAAGADYTAASGTVTFAAGDTAEAIAVPVTQDTLDETDETLTVTLTDPSDATVGDGTATGTITDDDASPTVSIADADVAEGNSGTATLSFAVSLGAASGRTVTVDVATADGSAVAGDDYTALSQTVTIPAGQTGATVPVAVSGDTAVEADETLTLQASAATNATLADGEAAGRIVNDDQPPLPVLSVGDVSTPEGTGLGGKVVSVPVTLSAPAAGPVTVNVATGDNTAKAGSDYLAIGTTLTFAPGETAKAVAVQITTDTTTEVDETFGVGLSGPSGATIGRALGVVTLTNDDNPACVVPNVVGRTLTKATTLLRNAGCKRGKIIRRHNSRTKKNRIVKSSPPAATVLPRDHAVTVVLSKGRKPKKKR